MPVPKQIINYLDKRGAKYAIVTHRKVYTAYDAAQTLRRKLDEIAKNLLVKTDKGYVLILLPASKNVDLQALKKVINAQGKGVKKVELPKEGVMVRLFKVKPGALPAFGGPHDLEVYIDKSLLKAKKIILSSGSFTESIEMTMKEFEKLEGPVKGAFSKAKKLQKKIVKKVKKSITKGKRATKKGNRNGSKIKKTKRKKR